MSVFNECKNNGKVQFRLQQIINNVRNIRHVTKKLAELLVQSLHCNQ